MSSKPIWLESSLSPLSSFMIGVSKSTIGCWWSCGVDCRRFEIDRNPLFGRPTVKIERLNVDGLFIGTDSVGSIDSSTPKVIRRLIMRFLFSNTTSKSTSRSIHIRGFVTLKPLASNALCNARVAEKYCEKNAKLITIHCFQQFLEARSG